MVTWGALSRFIDLYSSWSSQPGKRKGSSLPTKPGTLDADQISPLALDHLGEHPNSQYLGVIMERRCEFHYRSGGLCERRSSSTPKTAFYNPDEHCSASDNRWPWIDLSWGIPTPGVQVPWCPGAMMEARLSTATLRIHTAHPRWRAFSIACLIQYNQDCHVEACRRLQACFRRKRGGAVSNFIASCGT